MPIDDAVLASIVTIAHGAGNGVRSAARAAALGADVVEADIHSYHGRLEVRHLKTLGRLPLLWDRWYLAPGWRRRLLLPELAADLATSPGPAIMLDLKGHDQKLPSAVIEAIADLRKARRVLVCGQNWSLLEPFLDAADVEVLHSIGREEQLAAFDARPELRGAGISIHNRLLTQDIVARLKQRVPFITTWPINDGALLERVVGFGVTAITTDSERILAGIAQAKKNTAETPGYAAQHEGAG
jgi:hypothetical protein